MAYVKRQETKYLCKECGEEVQFEFSSNLQNIFYVHDIESLTFVNGYPCPCKYNHQKLKKSQVKKVTTNIFAKQRKGVY